MEKKERLWELLLHEDNVFNNRLEMFFLVQSLLIAAMAILFNTKEITQSSIFLIIVVAMFLTLILGYILAKQGHILEKCRAECKKNIIEYREFIELRNNGIWNIRSTKILSYFLPPIVFILWTISLIYNIV
jgi:hypothetical protein